MKTMSIKEKELAHFFGFPFAKIFFSFQILLFYDFFYLQSLQCKQNIVAVNLVGISTSVLLEDALCELGKGPFNNYVDKMRGGGGQKCLFFSTFRV